MEEKIIKGVVVHDSHGNVVDEAPIYPQGTEELVSQHNADQDAHPQIQEAITGIRAQVARRLVGAKVTFNDGHTEDVELGYNDQGEVILLLPKETFGKIDGVKVNGEELDVDDDGKVDIPIPTTVHDLDPDDDYATKTETQAMVDEAKVTGATLDYQEDGGSPSAAVDFNEGSLDFKLKNMKMKFSDLTPEEKAEITGPKGDPGDNCYVGQGDLPLAQVVSQADDKAITPKAVSDAIYSYEEKSMVKISGLYVNDDVISTSNLQELYYIKVSVGDAVKIAATASKAITWRVFFTTEVPASGVSASDVTEVSSIKIEQVFTSNVNGYVGFSKTTYDVTLVSAAFYLQKAKYTIEMRGKTDVANTDALKEIITTISSSDNVSGTAVSGYSYIRTNGNLVTTSGAFVLYSFSVIGGQLYRIKGRVNDTSYVGYAFYDANSVFISYGEQGSGTARNFDSFVFAPSNAARVLVSSNPLQVNPSVALMVKPSTEAQKEEVRRNLGITGVSTKTIYPKMSRDYLNASGGMGHTGTSAVDVRFLLSTARFIKVNGNVTVTLKNNRYLKVGKYSSDFSLIGYNEYTIVADVPQTIDVGNAAYIKLMIAYDSNRSTVIMMERVAITGSFGDDWDVFNPRSADDGYQRIAVAVHVTDPTCCDGVTSEVQDTGDLWREYGVVCLPTTYQNTGEPTRLIIYCHGAAVNYGWANSRFDSADVDPAYWLAEGYAVMDIEGNPFNNTDEHILMPQAMDCYVAGYKWVIDHYNIKRDGVFLGGRSMGGANTFNLIRRECPIPVIAACPNVPAQASFGYSNNSAARKEFCALHMGFDIPSGYEFKNASNMSQDDILAEDQLLSDNWDKWIKCLPMLTMCVDMPSKETFMTEWGKHDGSLYRTFMKTLHARVKCPVKIFGCYEDAACNPETTSICYYQMLINAGQIVELRLFHDSRYWNGETGTPNSNAHHYEIQDTALRTTATTRFGTTVADVPVPYIEMMKFWKRYEQEDL